MYQPLRGDLAEQIGAAIGDEALDQRLHRAARHQGAKTGFENAGMDAGEIDHREALRHLRGIERLAWQAERAVRFDRLGEIGIGVGEEKQHAGRME